MFCPDDSLDLVRALRWLTQTHMIAVLDDSTLQRAISRIFVLYGMPLKLDHQMFYYTPKSESTPIEWKGIIRTNCSCALHYNIFSLRITRKRTIE